MLSFEGRWGNSQFSVSSSSQHYWVGLILVQLVLIFQCNIFLVIGFWQSPYFFPQFNTLQPKCKGVNMLTRVIFWRSMRKFSIFRLVIESTLLAGLIFDWTDWSQIRLSRVSNPHRVGRASIHGLPNVFSGMKSKL